MVSYTLPQNPDTIITVRGKESPRARQKAMDKLVEMMDSGEILTELENGFSPEQFIEVKESKESKEIASEEEEAVAQAVQILSDLAALKIKVVESREEALKIRSAIEVLFTDEAVTVEEIANLKDGFKVLKTFAVANLRYREAREKAEEARIILDQALKSAESEIKQSPKPDK
ncbi:MULTISPECIES: hypothetical protein [Okeania]|uniref:hypothetical protein n=1 Tax=Okeania TaxID=1458928 RepID=UPI000F53CBEA|nr:MULTISPECIES: hypothetical protein [Okeania]NEP88228.1 hypothetical protein [Okeania sp. SIO2C2]NEQ74793.1 hypothetical protein [Okeania sp. SIO2C9]NES79277.1 hypothetical protein [Okeania sp. SIO1H4]NES93405.1 hypothetical protein [Okeania sp. SIO2B9]NET23000.1 hypothetical protein [Okeania sp. SIO1H5]